MYFGTIITLQLVLDSILLVISILVLFYTLFFVCICLLFFFFFLKGEGKSPSCFEFIIRYCLRIHPGTSSPYWSYSYPSAINTKFSSNLPFFIHHSTLVFIDLFVGYFCKL